MTNFGSLISIVIDQEFILKFVLALVLGAFIGTEREMIQQRLNLQEFGGIRSFMLISLSGFLASFLSSWLSFWFIILLLLIISGFIAIDYTHKSFVENKSGVTSELSGILTFMVGVLAYFDYSVAIIVGIITALVLSIKVPLHSFVTKVKDTEFLATAEFALLTFVILPLLPNRTIDPWGMINPYEIWLLIVFVLGISFIGYILHRVLGSKKGLLLTGIVGGIISSTALTQSMSVKSKSHPKLQPALQTATIMASGIMFVRILLIISPLNQGLFFKLLVPIGLMFLVTLLQVFFSFLRLRKKDVIQEEPAEDMLQESPFKLLPAIKFSVLLVAILIITELAKNYLGAQGLYLTALVTGLADVDVFMLSIVKIIITDPSFAATGAKAIALAVIANMVSKGLIPFFFGDRKFAFQIFKNFALTIAVGILAITFF